MATSETFWLTVELQIQLVFILIGVIVFLTIPRSGRLEYFEVGLMLMLAAATDTTSTVGYFAFHTNMNLVPNIYGILVLPIGISLYRKRIHWKNVNTIAYTIIIMYVLFGLINLFFIQGPFGYNSYLSSVRAICFIVISLTYFYVLIQQLPTESITRLPMFWINTAILIYYSGTFFMHLTADYLINVLNNNMIAYTAILYFIGLVYYPMLWYALLLVRAEHRKQIIAATN